MTKQLLGTHPEATLMKFGDVNRIAFYFPELEMWLVLVSPAGTAVVSCKADDLCVVMHQGTVPADFVQDASASAFSVQVL